MVMELQIITIDSYMIPYVMPNEMWYSLAFHICDLVIMLHVFCVISMVIKITNMKYEDKHWSISIRMRHHTGVYDIYQYFLGYFLEVRPGKIVCILMLKQYHDFLTRMTIYGQSLSRSSCIAYQTKLADVS